MIIETQADVGDIVWYITDNMAMSSKVSRIDVAIVNTASDIESVAEPKIIIQYSTTHGKFNPERVFKTREDLANFILTGSV